MYNRYIPQRDGSYRRSPTPEASQSPPRQAHETPRERAAPSQRQPGKEQETPQMRSSFHSAPQEAGSFLKNLLPKNFDTADLLIVLLILLMAGDAQEDQNTALLTLALYFFL